MLLIRYNGELARITDEIIKDYKSAADGDPFHGHATQIIWAKTNKLGCAYKKCEVSKTFGFTNYNVCT